MSTLIATTAKFSSKAETQRAVADFLQLQFPEYEIKPRMFGRVLVNKDAKLWCFISIKKNGAKLRLFVRVSPGAVVLLVGPLIANLVYRSAKIELNEEIASALKTFGYRAAETISEKLF